MKTVKLLKDLDPIPHHIGTAGLHWKYFNCSIVLNAELYSNGIDTYEIMLPDGDIIGYQSETQINRVLVEQQLPIEKAKIQYPELYI